MAKCESCGTETISINWRPADPRWLCRGCFEGPRPEHVHEWYFVGGAPTPSYKMASKAEKLGVWDGSGRIE